MVVEPSEDGGCAARPAPRGEELPRLLCGARIDVNRATEAELVLLPGIGPSRAKRIAESREEEGPFRDAEDLTRVRGIGDKTARAVARWVEF